MKTRFLALTVSALAIAGAAHAQPAASSATASSTATATATAAVAPLSPPVAGKADVVETLATDGRFKIVAKGLTDTALDGMLKKTPTITLFAPTDAAIDPAEATRLQADRGAMQQFLLLHMINAPVDAAKIKGSKGPVKTLIGKMVLLDGSNEAQLQAGGANIVQADVKPTAGLLQVIDKAMVEDTSPPAPAQ